MSLSHLLHWFRAHGTTQSLGNPLVLCLSALSWNGHTHPKEGSLGKACLAPAVFLYWFWVSGTFNRWERFNTVTFLSRSRKGINNSLALLRHSKKQDRKRLFFFLYFFFSHLRCAALTMANLFCSSYHVSFAVFLLGVQDDFLNVSSKFWFIPALPELILQMPSAFLFFFVYIHSALEEHSCPPVSCSSMKLRMFARNLCCW